MTSNWVRRAIANNLAPHARGAVRADLRPADFGGTFVDDYGYTSPVAESDYAAFAPDPPEFDRTIGDEDRDWYVALPEPENGGPGPAYNPLSAAPADYVGDLPHPDTHPEWLDEGGSE